MNEQLNSVLFFLCILTHGKGFTQGFIQPVENPASKECYVTLNDNVEFKCELRSALFSGGTMKSFSIKDEDGVKHKYKAEDVKKLRFKMTDLAKLEAMSEGSGSIAELASLDFDEIIDREYIFFEQALLPKKKDKYALLQLLNPGFDERISVYQDPGAKETMGVGLGDVQLTGGKDKSYLVVKDRQKSIKVKKGSYKKDFSELFNDCTQMLEVFSKGGKIKFSNMASHVLYYNTSCK
jgi:hypothetical protein